jgi:VanZ family protein
MKQAIRPPDVLMKIKTLALLFLLFILLVIIAADAGGMPAPIRALYSFPNGDRLGHFILYGILAFLLASAFPRPLRWGRLSVPVVIVALVVFAAAEEYSQRFFATRTSDIVDLTCSCIGILCGTWLASRRKR